MTTEATATTSTESTLTSVLTAGSAFASGFEFEHVRFAKAAHGPQLYGGAPYSVHLRMVEQVLDDHGFSSLFWRMVAWLHDVIEDCFLIMSPEARRREVAMRFGEEVAATVWAVSGFGPNRSLRNADIYSKIAGFQKACILKCADRIVNVETSVREKHSMGKVYLKERASFDPLIEPHVPASMFARLQAGYAKLEQLAA